MRVRKAIIPVAGLGTRFLPATKSIPKEMFPIVDKPSIQYIVEEALQSGIEQIIFINAHGKEAIEDHFDKNIELEAILHSRKQQDLLKQVRAISHMAKTITVRQKTPLGLGHAILCAKDVIGDEPFAILLADDLVDAQRPCLLQLIDFFKKKKTPVIALMEVPKEHTNLYGIARVTPDQEQDRLYDICEVVEKPAPSQAPSRLAIIGRYILTPDIFRCLEEISIGKGNEVQLTDAIQRMLAFKKVLGYRYEGKRFDTGDKLGFLQANIYFGLKRKEFRKPLIQLLKTLKL